MKLGQREADMVCEEGKMYGVGEIDNLIARMGGQCKMWVESRVLMHNGWISEMVLGRNKQYQVRTINKEMTGGGLEGK